jgi:hypothetical protein
MRLLVHSKACSSSGDFDRHFAISAHKPSRKLSPVIDVIAIFGFGLVSRKFHAHHASTQLLPGPLAAFMARR